LRKKKRKGDPTLKGGGEEHRQDRHLKEGLVEVLEEGGFDFYWERTRERKYNLVLDSYKMAIGGRPGDKKTGGVNK